MWETLVWSLGWEDPPEEGMATHSSALAWRIPMDRGAWRATVHGSQRGGRDWRTKHSTQRPNTLQEEVDSSVLFPKSKHGENHPNRVHNQQELSPILWCFFKIFQFNAIKCQRLCWWEQTGVVPVRVGGMTCQGKPHHRSRRPWTSNLASPSTHCVVLGKALTPLSPRLLGCKMLVVTPTLQAPNLY